MAERADELKKLVTIASDTSLPGELRSRTIKAIGNMATREALLALLDLVANDRLDKGERELALKQAHVLIKRSPS